MTRVFGPKGGIGHRVWCLLLCSLHIYFMQRQCQGKTTIFLTFKNARKAVLFPVCAFCPPLEWGIIAHRKGRNPHLCGKAPNFNDYRRQ